MLTYYIRQRPDKNKKEGGFAMTWGLVKIGGMCLAGGALILTGLLPFENCLYFAGVGLLFAASGMCFE